MVVYRCKPLCPSLQPEKMGDNVYVLGRKGNKHYCGKVQEEDMCNTMILHGMYVCVC